jgi:hypothetical protein
MKRWPGGAKLWMFTKAAESLRKVAALTVGLPEDSPADAKLRDHLDLAADVLDSTVRTEEEP